MYNQHGPLATFLPSSQQGFAQVACGFSYLIYPWHILSCNPAGLAVASAAVSRPCIHTSLRVLLLLDSQLFQGVFALDTSNLCEHPASTSSSAGQLGWLTTCVQYVAGTREWQQVLQHSIAEALAQLILWSRA